MTRLKDGVYQELTPEDFAEFAKICPVITDLLHNKQKISKVTLPKIVDTNIPIYDHWDKAAKRLINTIWRSNASKIFHKPVDPDRLGIPDYFEIVKDPIDLGTIKQRLSYNYYF